VACGTRYCGNPWHTLLFAHEHAVGASFNLATADFTNSLLVAQTGAGQVVSGNTGEA
jgi:hypothetical protein